MKGVCLGVPKKEDYPVFLRALEEILPANGYDTLVFLIRYQFPFARHPGVATPDALTLTQAKEIAALCRRTQIRLIPKMNLLGHQSGKQRGTEDGLLKAHPEFDETPDLDAYLTGKGFRTVVCPWREIKATQALLAYAGTVRSDNLLGVLQTSWCSSGNVCRELLGQAVSGDEYAPPVAASFKVVANSPLGGAARGTAATDRAR